MRFAAIIIFLLFVAGCDPRSPDLPPTNKWVRFHCPTKHSDKHAFMVEMPGKPSLQLGSIYQTLNLGGQQMDVYTYACTTDGEFTVSAVELPRHEIEPPPSDDEFQTFGKIVAQKLDATLTENKPFLYEQKHPALDLAGAQKRGLAGNFRARMIFSDNYMIMLMVTGRTSVVRELEVTYFFDSLLLYK
jgi:hypothetical protein